MRRLNLFKESFVCNNIRRNINNESYTNVRSTASSGSKVYDSKRAVHEYLLTHYGKSHEIMPYEFNEKGAFNFTERLAILCSKHARNNGRVLDLGCAVGGSSFHLTKSFNDVVGIDFSNHFIDAANVMKNKGKMEYEILKQGQIYTNTVAEIPTGSDPSKLTFQVGDACNLKTTLGQFDVILCSNLLCRLPSPRNFLNSVGNFLKSSGVVILVSPYSWLEEYTPLNEWIGAKDNIDR
jgi:putative 4-mercaptohistidine N1-methyltranferase